MSTGDVVANLVRMVGAAGFWWLAGWWLLTLIRMGELRREMDCLVAELHHRYEAQQELLRVRADVHAAWVDYLCRAVASQHGIPARRFTH